MLLGVHDAMPGRHQVQFAGPNRLLTAEAVPMKDLSRQQPRHRLQPDVWVRPDARTGGGNPDRACVVEETPGADGAADTLRQGPIDMQQANRRLPRVEHLELVRHPVSLTHPSGHLDQELWTGPREGSSGQPPHGSDVRRPPVNRSGGGASAAFVLGNVLRFAGPLADGEVGVVWFRAP